MNPYSPDILQPLDTFSKYSAENTRNSLHQNRKIKRARAAASEPSQHVITASEVEHALSEALNADKRDH